MINTTVIYKERTRNLLLFIHCHRFLAISHAVKDLVDKIIIRNQKSCFRLTYSVRQCITAHQTEPGSAVAFNASYSITFRVYWCHKYPHPHRDGWMKYRNIKTAISQKWVKIILQQIFAFFYSTLLSTSVSRRMGYFIHYYIILIFVNFYLHVTTAYILQSEEIDVAETSDGHGCYMGYGYSYKAKRQSARMSKNNKCRRA